jgi:hypothetical protein
MDLNLGHLVSICGFDNCDSSAIRRIQRACNVNVKMHSFALNMENTFPCNESTELNKPFLCIYLDMFHRTSFVQVRRALRF